MNVMRAIAHYTEGRLFEWAMALTMMLLGIQLAVSPRLLSGWDTAWLVLLSVGALRTAALIANGRSYVYGPRVRAFGALIGAVVWSQVFVALLLLVPRHYDTPSLGLPVLLVLTICELYSSYRAATDVRTPPSSRTLL